MPTLFQSACSLRTSIGFKLCNMYLYTKPREKSPAGIEEKVSSRLLTYMLSARSPGCLEAQVSIHAMAALVLRRSRKTCIFKFGKLFFGGHELRKRGL